MAYYTNIVKYGSEKYLDEIQTLCKPLEDSYGITHFSASISSLVDKRPIRVLSNEPETLTRYFKKGFFNLDCIAFELSLKSIKPKELYTSIRSPHYDNIFNSEFIKKRVIEGLHDLGLRQCISIQRVERKSVITYAFGTQCESPGFVAEALTKVNQLLQFGDQFIENTQHIFTELSPHAIPSKDYSNPSLIVKLLHWLGLSPDIEELKSCAQRFQFPISKENKSFNGIGATNELVKSITKRQYQCLLAYSQGCDTKEIAKKLHLSTRTVENHIYNARKKMGAKNNVEFYQMLQKLFTNPDFATN